MRSNNRSQIKTSSVSSQDFVVGQFCDAHCARSSPQDQCCRTANNRSADWSRCSDYSPWTAVCCLTVSAVDPEVNTGRPGD